MTEGWGHSGAAVAGGVMSGSEGGAIPHPDSAWDKNELWGEFASGANAAGSSSSVGLTQQEKDFLTRLPRPLPLEGPRIHQPGSSASPSASAAAPPPPESSNPLVILPFSETWPRDPYVLHSLALLNYLQQLKQFLNRDYVGAAVVPLPPPQLSEPLPTGAKAFRHQGPFAVDGNSSRSRDDNDPDDSKVDVKPDMGPGASSASSATSAATTTPMPSVESVRGVLHKSVATLAAFSGYDLATDTALNLLTDAAGDFVKTFCAKMLRNGRDAAILDDAGGGGGGSGKSGQGFADLLDRTLTEVQGVGMEEMVTYYQHNVVNRYAGILAQCKTAFRECHLQVQPPHPPPESAFPNMTAVGGGGGGSPKPMAAGAGVHVHKGSEADNIPEIHFPAEAEGGAGMGRGGVAIGGAFQSDALQIAPSSQIETGMQMLQSLEEQAQSLVGEGSTGNNSSAGAAMPAAAMNSPVGGPGSTRPPSLVIPPGSVIAGGITYHEDLGSPVIPQQQQQQQRKRKNMDNLHSL